MTIARAPKVMIWGRGLRQISGNRAYVDLITRELAGEFDFRVLTHAGPLADTSPADGVRFLTSETHQTRGSLSARAKFAVASMRALLREPHVTLIHSIGSSPVQAALAATAGVIRGIPVILELASPGPAWLGKLPVQIILCPSENVAANLGAKATVLRRPIDLQRFQATREPYDLPRRGPVVGGMGKPDARHGLEVTVRAFHRLLRTHPDATLALAIKLAASDRVHRIHALIDELDLREHVIILGDVDPERFFHSIDVFVYPVRTTRAMVDTPSALIECLAASCPVVAPSVGGIPELGIEEAGVLLRPGSEVDPDRVSDAVRVLLAGPQRLQQIRSRLPATLLAHEKGAVLTHLSRVYRDAILPREAVMRRAEPSS